MPHGSPGNASVSITYFHNRIRDLIMAQPLPNGAVYSPVNIDRARAEGIETTLALRMSAWLQADLTYTYTDARDLGTGLRLARRPFNQGSANLRISPFPGFVVTPELLYVGSSLDFLTDDSGFPGAEGLTPSGLIFNLNLSWQVTPALQVFVWGKNLGDSTYEPANGFQSPGTSAMAGVRYGF
jgi:outer membrane cobalamin receptor